MSSETYSGGTIADAVADIAYDAGWLARQSGKLLAGSLVGGGKLLVEAKRTVDRQVAEKKLQLEELAAHRKRSAAAAHSQLTDLCTRLLTQIDKDIAAADIADFVELEQLKVELNNICRECVPDDAAQLEELNTLGLLKFEKILAKQQRLSAPRIENNDGDLYKGLAFADLMKDIRVSVSAMKIQATDGVDIQAVDPVVLERVKLNEKLESVTARTMEALKCVADLSVSYGLSASNDAWLQSCFNGVDEQIGTLHMPSTSNTEMKKGIKRIEEMLDQYDMLMPGIESEQRKFADLYQVYVDASKALGEPVAGRKSFQSLPDLEKRLSALKERSERARECAEIYQKLGSAAYICYAWDQELCALGYTVHTRKDIAEMAKYKPQRARLGENKLPFYDWGDRDLTQLYSMASGCSLQVIVHEDGSVSMQTISDTADDNKVKEIQAGHCSLLNKLHENLRKNWFIIYDYQETASPDEVTSAAEWFASEHSAWTPGRDDLATKRRRKDKNESIARQSQ